MFDAVLFSAIFLASAAYTVWVYWGVPVRVLAVGAFLGGIVWAAVHVAVLGIARLLFDGSIDSRVLASFALGCGVGFGGLLSLLLNLLRIPSSDHGA